MTKYLQESRMREIRTSGLTRGSNGTGESRLLLSTLPRGPLVTARLGAVLNGASLRLFWDRFFGR